MTWLNDAVLPQPTRIQFATFRHSYLARVSHALSLWTPVARTEEAWPYPHRIAATAVAFIQKPCISIDLTEKVRPMLDVEAVRQQAAAMDDPGAACARHNATA